jgi:hypothetical protein
MWSTISSIFGGGGAASIINSLGTSGLTGQTPTTEAITAQTTGQALSSATTLSMLTPILMIAAAVIVVIVIVKK